MRITGPNKQTPGTVAATTIPRGTVFTGTLSGDGAATSTFLCAKWFSTGCHYLADLVTGTVYPTFGVTVTNYVPHEDAEVKL